MKRSSRSRANLGFTIDRSSDAPLWRQVFQSVADLVDSGVLTAGDVLPSVRSLASQLGVSPDTVKAAYAELKAAGYVMARARSSVSVLGRETDKQPHTLPQFDRSEPVRLPPMTERGRYAARIGAAPDSSIYPDRPFAPYAPVSNVLLDKDWLRIAGAQARAPWRSAAYSPAQGNLGLRRAIAEKLRLYRGIQADPGEIIITSSSVQSLSLCASVLFAPGDEIWAEAPLTNTFFNVLPFWGLKPRQFRVDRGGLCVKDAMEACPAAAGVLVSPVSQMPLSVPLSAERKARLASWAGNHEAFFILEDDSSSFLSGPETESAPLFSTRGASGKCVYLSSLSPLLFPGIKISYLVAPKGLVKALVGAKSVLDRGISFRKQEVVADFLTSPGFETYRRKLLRHYRENYAALANAVSKYLSPFGHLTESHGNGHACFVLNASLKDSLVSRRANELGITARAVSCFQGALEDQNGLVLGFSGFTKEEIEKGVAVLGEACRSVLSRGNRPAP